MKGKDLKNREIDNTARQLINAARPGPAEIDSVVSNPQLYDGVMARIAAMPENETRSVARTFWKPVFAAAFAAAAASLPMLAYFTIRSAETADLQERKIPAAYSVRESPIRPSMPVTLPASAGPGPHQADEPKAEYAVLRPAERQVAKQVRPTRAKSKTETAQDAVFHPIGSAEKAEDAAIDNRVVRVELPRSTLFAMGIDVPLENGTRPVNAELLLGPDGAPRAIRLVE